MIIGLTGGIASGKSVVAHYLQEKGLPIVDADVVARQVVEPGSIGLSEIITHFGSKVIDGNTLDRKALRDIIFEDESKRLLLNSILHPIIHEEILKQLNQYQDEGHALIVFDAPLLLENDLKHMVDELWVVSTTVERQIDRVITRDHISKEEALNIINKQMSLKDKETHADVILYNNNSISELHETIDRLLEDRL